MSVEFIWMMIKKENNSNQWDVTLSPTIYTVLVWFPTTIRNKVVHQVLTDILRNILYTVKLCLKWDTENGKKINSPE